MMMLMTINVKFKMGVMMIQMIGLHAEDIDDDADEDNDDDDDDLDYWFA